jgi:hypothetical protein
MAPEDEEGGLNFFRVPHDLDPGQTSADQERRGVHGRLAQPVPHSWLRPPDSAWSGDVQHLKGEPCPLSEPPALSHRAQCSVGEIDGGDDTVSGLLHLGPYSFVVTRG